MFAFRDAIKKRESIRKAVKVSGLDENFMHGERRLAARLAVTEPVLRAEVLHDLAMLVNTVAMESTIDLEAFSDVRQSILNYGLPDIAARTIDEESVGNIGKEVELALKNFEPRLMSQSVKVVRDITLDRHELRIRFIVSADLACNPVNVPVQFVADVELATSKIVIKRL